MDDGAKEVVQIFAEEALRPATDLIDNIIGVLGGDRLADFRERQSERRKARHASLGADAITILQSRSIKEPVEPNAGAVDELATAAQDEPREELRRLWAQLLAAMFDPKRTRVFRREFITIAKQLEPIDAATLPILAAHGELVPSRKEFVAERLGVSVGEVEVAFRNLARLELVWPSPEAIGNPKGQPFLTSLGRQFIATVAS